jgi:hypothetical protein
MIDFETEPPINLATAARQIPPARNGKKTHVGTILRWIMSGAKRPDGEKVRLEAIRVGGRWFTSHEALKRFAEALTPSFGDTTPTPATPGKRRRAAERAAKELEKVGI